MHRRPRRATASARPRRQWRWRRHAARRPAPTRCRRRRARFAPPTAPAPETCPPHPPAARAWGQGVCGGGGRRCGYRVVVVSLTQLVHGRRGARVSGNGASTNSGAPAARKMAATRCSSPKLWASAHAAVARPSNRQMQLTKLVGGGHSQRGSRGREAESPQNARVATASNSPDHQVALESIAVSATVPCVRVNSWRLQPGTDGDGGGRGRKRRTTSASACSRHPRCASSSCSTIVAATGCPLSEASAASAAGVAAGSPAAERTSTATSAHHVQTARLSSRTRARGGTSHVDQSLHAQRSS